MIKANREYENELNFTRRMKEKKRDLLFQTTYYPWRSFGACVSHPF